MTPVCCLVLDLLAVPVGELNCKVTLAPSRKHPQRKWRRRTERTRAKDKTNRTVFISSWEFPGFPPPRPVVS